jgi:hypothetical protein
MIAAGIGDHAAPAFFLSKRRNLVVCPSEFEGADRLLVLGLEEEPAVVGGAVRLMNVRLDWFCAHGNAPEASLSIPNVV